MSPLRHKTSPVLTDQVAGDTLGQIMSAGGAMSLPEVRPSLQDVPLDRIVAGSDLQTREDFNPQEDREDAELVESVREVGVRVPIHVQDQANGKYRVQSGHRRVIAARLAGMRKIPSIVSPPGSDAFDTSLDTWLENLHRKDLSPLERSEMLALLQERFDLPRSAETARRLGLSKTSYYRYLSLLEAPEDVKKALSKGVLGVAQAERIGAIDDAKVRLKVIQAAKAGVSAKRIDQALSDHRSGESIDDRLIDSEPRSGGNSHRGGAGASEKTWAKRKASELADTLGLKADALAKIEKALKARRISGAHATAASLLIASGEPAETALETIAALDRNAICAVEMFFNVAYKPGSSTGYLAGRTVLRRILGILIGQLEAGTPPGARL